MDNNELLSRLTIATPCPMDWDRMPGDDRVRYCGACGKHVHNFAAMTSDEATSLLRTRQGRLCGRILQRSDGTVVTSDCPPELQPAPRPPQYRIRSLMAVIAGLAAALGIARLFWPAENSQPRAPAPAPGATTQLVGDIY
jgi:hypothetical protein